MARAFPWEGLSLRVKGESRVERLCGNLCLSQPDFRTDLLGIHSEVLVGFLFCIINQMLYDYSGFHSSLTSTD